MVVTSTNTSRSYLQLLIVKVEGQQSHNMNDRRVDATY
jgi:hypothetical protein